MTDAEIAKKLQVTVEAFNAALRDAAVAGIEVDIRVIEVSAHGVPARAWSVLFEATRITKVVVSDGMRESSVSDPGFEVRG